MAEKTISNSEELELRLAQLKVRKKALENSLGATAEEVYDNLRHPSKMIRACVKDLAGDSEFRTSLLRLATNAFTRFFTRKRKEPGKMSRIISEVVDFLADRFDKK